MNDEILRLFSIGKAMKAKSALMVFCRWNEPVLKARRGVAPSKRPLKVWHKEGMTNSESRYGNCLCLHMWSIYACFCSGPQACPRRSPVLSISFPPSGSRVCLRLPLRHQLLCVGSPLMKARMQKVCILTLD